MASLDYCYRLLLINYIILNIKNIRYKDIESLSISELEDKVKKIVEDLGLYAIFTAGISLYKTINEESNDVINGISAIIDDFLMLFGIEKEK
mgnify:CR=1 FL=1